MEGYYEEVIVGLSFTVTLLGLLCCGLWFELSKQRRIAKTLGDRLSDVLAFSDKMVKAVYKK